MKKKYQVQFEIAGENAMFTRPDTGSSFVSYPAPTFSAAKGMFESIVRLKSAFIKPVKVEICKPIKFQQYTTNYGGPLRKLDQITKGNSYQLKAMILTDVCYRIYGVIEELQDFYIDKQGNKLKINYNHIHYLQDKFNRRLKKGKCHYTPCLGWKEFIPTYFGCFREETKIETSINEYIPSMLYSPFDKLIEGTTEAIYKQNIWIKEGVLIYD